MSRQLRKIARLQACLGLFLLAASAAPAAESPAPDTSAPRAIVLDHRTGKVLFAKNANAPTAPASLAKLMTVEVLFDRVRKGQVSLSDQFVISDHAGRFGQGSRMALTPGARVAVRDLLRGALVISANNAAIAIAEGIAGSIPRFAALMNQRAKEIGLANSRFANPHGLSDPGQHVTMADMALLASHLIRTYPEHYRYLGEAEFTFNGVTQRNRNPLLGSDVGADGLKTGQTNQAGYALVASAERNGRRLVLAMSGLKSESDRASEGRKLLEWGFRRPPE